MEIYQWLLRRNGFVVSDTGYFLFANASTDRGDFLGKLEFDTQLVAYQGSDAWVEDAILGAHDCLMRETIPRSSPECEWCAYREGAAKFARCESETRNIHRRRDT
jgi:hypothetical protein